MNPVAPGPILEGAPEPVAAQCSAPTSGPVEPTVRRHLGLLITALAFLGDLHLRSGKMPLEAFVAAATETHWTQQCALPPCRR